MAEMWGADADRLDAIGVELDRAGVALAITGKRLARALDSAPWHGTGADRFRQEFHTTHARAIADAAGFLEEAKSQLALNARQQREASGVTGSAALSGMAALKHVLEDLNRELYEDVVPHALDVAGGVLKSDLFGGVFGLVGFGLGVWTYGQDAGEPGGFGVAHRVADQLDMASGLFGASAAAVGGLALLLGPVPVVDGVDIALAPIAAALEGTGVVLGGVAAGIDMTIDYWNDSGRQLWHDVSPTIDRQWDSSVDTVKSSWNAAYSAGSTGMHTADDVAKGAAHMAGDLAKGAVHETERGFTSLAGWL